MPSADPGFGIIRRNLTMAQVVYRKLRQETREIRSRRGVQDYFLYVCGEGHLYKPQLSHSGESGFQNDSDQQGIGRYST